MIDRQIRRTAESPRRSERACLQAALVLVTLPFLVSAVVWLVRGYTPTSDVSLIELRIRDVSSQFPLTGVYSRFGYEHPGPALFLLMWVPYHLLGSDGAALVASMLLWSAVLVGTVVALFGRHFGGRAALLAAGTAMAVVLIVGWKPVVEPWNPHITTLGGFGLIGLVFLSFGRSRLAAALVPFVGTVLLQAHLGTGVFVVTMLALWFVMPLVERRTGSPENRPGPIDRAREGDERDPGKRRLLFVKRSQSALTIARARVIGGVGAAVMWVPPMLDQLWGTHNFGRILASMRTDQPDQLQVGWPAGVRMTTMSWALPAWWSTDGKHGPLELLYPAFRTPWLLIATVAFITLAWFRRGGSGSAVRAAAVIAAVFVAMPPTFAGIRGVPWAYLVTWVPGAVVACIGLGVGVALLSTDHLSLSGVRVRPITTGLVAVAALAISAMTTLRAPSAQLDLPGASGAERLWKDLSGRLPQRPGSVLLRSDLSFPSMELVPAIVLLADRQGVPIHVESRLAASVIEDRIASTASREFLILTDGSADALALQEPDRIAATDDPFSESERRALSAAWTRMGGAMARGDSEAVESTQAAIDKTADGRHLTIIFERQG